VSSCRESSTNEVVVPFVQAEHGVLEASRIVD